MRCLKTHEILKLIYCLFKSEALFILNIAIVYKST
jgi:hypothetical protein